jgi:hypothetical protein
MALDPQTQLAFTFASDVAKELITISTAVIAFSVTFAKDVAEGITKGPRRVLIASWVFNLFSIGFGLMVLLLLTGILAPTRIAADVPLEIDVRVRVIALLQLLTFITGIVLMVSYGRSALGQLSGPVNQPQRRSSK